MADTVQLIKEKLSIVDVVSPYVKLTKSGRYWKGLSPFNKEKTPSFFVNPDRGSYYCFSSSQGGDAFSFIEKMEGVDFKGALKILAEKAGVPLVYEKNASVNKEKQDRLREALGEAEAFFSRHLDEKGKAYEYAISRGLTPETIRSWNLGLAPDSWRALLEELNGKGFTNQELVAAGLIKEADEKKGTWYDKFRNRLMFPIRDTAGRTVAFTGRALGDDEAKYMNSPETELYKKSITLFGMDRAKDAIRSRGFTLLVEGQFDLILAHQAGFTNTIALSGTALSSSHLSFIKRYSDNLMLALDADRAGLAASARTAAAALMAGMKVKAIRMPKGKDPADLIKEDSKGFAGKVATAEPIIEFFLAALAEGESDAHRILMNAEKVVMPLIAAMQSPLEKEHFISKAARALNMPPEAVRKSVSQVKLERPLDGQTARDVVATQGAKQSVQDMWMLRIKAVILNYPETELARRLDSEYARITGTPLPEVAPPEAVLFEVGLALGETPSAESGNDIIREFERAYLNDRLATAISELRSAETKKDEDAIKVAAAKCQELQSLLSVFSR